MKASYYLILTIFGFSCLSAQETNTISLQNMKTPNSPGFQILDISPSLIEKPSNPKEFTASLMSLSNNGSALPKNFAMEVTPFWLFKQRGSIKKYLNIDEDGRSTAFSGFFRKLSITLASVYNDSTSGSLLEKTNYLAIGVRTNILTLRSKEQSGNITKALKGYDSRVNTLRNPSDDLSQEQQNLMARKLELDAALEISTDIAVVKQLSKEMATVSAQLLAIEDKLKKAYEISTEELDKKLETDEEIKRYYKVMEEAPLFQLDAAFAYSDAYKDNKSENKRFNRSGAWITGTLNLAGFDKNNLDDKLSLLFIGKYISDNVLKDSIAITFGKEKAVDIGFKLEYNIKRLTIGIEHLNRKYSGGINNKYERTVGILQYKLSEDIYFTGSYGRNFGEANNLFTLFGINYGFGKSSLQIDD